MRRYMILVALAAVACTGGDGGETTTTAPTTTTSTVETTTTTSPTTSSSTTSTSTTTTTLPPLQSLAYEQVASYDFPVQALPGPASGIVYVVDKVGYVWALVNGEAEEVPVLDITGLVSGRSEQGLLSVALHPDDGTRMFVHYTDRSGDTAVVEYALDDPLRADAESARVLLEVNQPASNHNGGMLQFADAGTLMLGLGDGGGANDAYGNGQDRDTLLGGLVAIDPDSGEAELYDYGLRNPWRFWIDEGRVYIADVGQNAYEEINAVDLEQGLNFGWPIMEGLHCFRSSGCDTDGLVLPVVEIAHGDEGTCSVTGGVVYRGIEIPELSGHYLFSDYCGGYLRSFDTTGDEIEVVDWTSDVGVPGRITGFGTDENGEVFVITSSEVLRLVAVR